MANNSLKAFISYSSAQKKFAEEMISEIGKDLVTFDKYSFENGDGITESIKRGIEGCDIFILLISNEALDSKWVHEEIELVLPLTVTKGVDFRPYQIDDKVKVNDNRLPDWVWGKIVGLYKYPKLLARTVQRVIREQIWKKYPGIKEQESYFVGRNNDMAIFETKYYKQDHAKLKVIFVSGFPYVGRKTFLYHFIKNYVQTVQETVSPIVIRLHENDNIDQFVMNLNEYVGKYPIDKLIDAFLEGSEVAVKYGVTLLGELCNYNEKVIIEDDGCIVKAGGSIVDWFMDFIKNVALPSGIVLYIASRFKPNNGYANNHSFMTYSIGTLHRDEMYSLFKKCLLGYSLSLGEDDMETFMKCFSGYPIQAIDTAEKLKDSDLISAKKYAENHRKRFDGNYTTVLGQLSDKAHDLIILLSKSDYFSCDLLQMIYGEENIVPMLEELNMYSLYETSGRSNELISLSSPLSDFISRQRKALSPSLKRQLNQATCQILQDLPKELTDISTVLLHIKENIRQSIKTNDDRYLIPSFVLKVIVEEYHAEHDDVVASLANRILNNYNTKNYDSCLRPIHYWYCCALCRLQNRDEFDKQVEFFSDDERDLNYLKGFYFRHMGKKKRMEDAKYYYEKALSCDDWNSVLPLTSKVKIDHELVIVYMKLGRYDLAVPKAKSNYDNNRDNTYHIRAYFNCLINTSTGTVKELESLISAMRDTHDRGVDIFVPTMEAQLQYYKDHNLENATKAFRNIISSRGKFGRTYAIDSFRKICMQYGYSYMSIFSKIVNDSGGTNDVDEDRWSIYEAI